MLFNISPIRSAYEEAIAAASAEADLKVEILEETIQQRGRLPRTKTVEFSGECKFFDVYNSLLHKTEDVIRLKVSGSQFFTATYLDGQTVQGQVSPWWHIQEKILSHKMKLLFFRSHS